MTKEKDEKCCELCGALATENQLWVDYSLDTGEIYGFLCGDCMDHVHWLRHVLTYLGVINNE